MNVATLKPAILAFIEFRGGDVTFVELMKEFESETGDEELSSGFPNVILWMGLSKNLAEALIGLMDDGELIIEETGQMTYLLDGATLKFPIAKSIRDYKQPHWLPAIMNTKNSKRRNG